MKRFARGFVRVLKWMLIAVISVEVLSFVAISVSNFILYGQAREGSRAVYDPYTLFLQSSGVRPTAHNAVSPDPAKNRVLWMFGGSTMRGATDFDDRTIPSFLARDLNGRQNGLRYTVENFGMNSFNSLLESKYLQKLLIETARPPDVIIFYDGANDAKYLLEHRQAYGHHGYRRTKALIESYYKSWLGLLKPVNAAVYASFTKELYDKINQVFIPLEPDSPELTEMVNANEKRYEYVNKVARCFGAELVLYWQPMLWVEECRPGESVKKGEKGLVMDSARLETMRRNFTIPYEALAERLKSKPYFVSFRNVLCARTSPGYQADGVHMTDDGRRLVAEAMGKDLEKRLSAASSRRGESPAVR